MSKALLFADRRVQAEIDQLRATCTDTQELYREVCVLLFYRHDITPTANKLYCLVRKGSMNAPAKVLSRFWKTLSDKRSVRIKHPDLPNGLRDVAGEVIAGLWQSAQALAHEGLAVTRRKAQALVLAA